MSKNENDENFNLFFEKWCPPEKNPPSPSFPSKILPKTRSKMQTVKNSKIIKPKFKIQDEESHKNFIKSSHMKKIAHFNLKFFH